MGPPPPSPLPPAPPPPSAPFPPRSLCRRALELDSTNFECWKGLGLAQQALGKKQEALQSLLMAAKRDVQASEEGLTTEMALRLAMELRDSEQARFLLRLQKRRGLTPGFREATRAQQAEMRRLLTDRPGMDAVRALLMDTEGHVPNLVGAKVQKHRHQRPLLLQLQPLWRTLLRSWTVQQRQLQMMTVVTAAAAQARPGQ